MAWCDKLGLFILTMLALFGLWMGATSGNPASIWFPAFLPILGMVALKIALPVWIVLRVVDLVIAGPARRQQKAWRGVSYAHGAILDVTPTEPGTRFWGENAPYAIVLGAAVLVVLTVAYH